jgi:MFS family permease
MKAAGTRSTAPLTESFARWGNLKLVILALLGATAGQAVVWYCGQFYALFFLTQVLKVAAQPANLLIAGALLIATPFFIVFGALSDRIGRKKIVLAGCLIAAVTYVPIFKGLTHYANPAIESASTHSPVTVVADPNACSFQFDPVGKKKFVQSCDIAKAALSKAGVPYSNVAAATGSVAQVRIGTAEPIASVEGGTMSAADFKAASEAFSKSLTGTLKQAGYPAKADPDQINYPMVLLLLVVLVIYVTMVYGPIAAWLIELFPARIRYTSMSLPYHIGNGWFGGFLPTVSFALVAMTGDIYYGLRYPIIVAVMTLIIGALALPETKDRNIS